MRLRAAGRLVVAEQRDRGQKAKLELREPMPATEHPRSGAATHKTESTSISTRKLPLFLTVEETAELLRTSKGAVYVMKSRGQLPGVTIVGRRLLVRSDELLHWLDQRRAPSLEVKR